MNSLNDPGDGTCDETECTLREAIAFASPGAVITFSPALTAGGPAQIVLIGDGTNAPIDIYKELTHSALEIDRDVTISGPGADRLTITQGVWDRDFLVTGGTVTISGLAIAGGIAPAELFGGSIDVETSRLGGGILNQDGILTLDHVAVTGNNAVGGGGIYNYGVLKVISSSVSGNAAIMRGGAIANFGGADVVNSSFFGNQGGTIIENAGPLQLRYTTIAFNFIGSRFEVQPTALISGGTALYFATILASNTNFRAVGGNCGGSQTVIDNGFNIDDGTACGFLTEFGSLSSTDPLLQSPAYNGGPTQTIALKAGSPAINVIPRVANGCASNTNSFINPIVITADQRDVTRLGKCDIGAYEAVGVAGAPDTKQPVLTLPGDQTLSATGPGGAVDTFAASALDETDGTVAVSCAPSSGSTFPIGTTQVACSAHDAAGNQATGSFNITVLGAPALLSALETAINGLSLDASTARVLLNAVTGAQTSLAKGNTAATCSKLTDLLSAMSDKVSAGKLTATAAAGLTRDANRIRAVIGC